MNIERIIILCALALALGGIAALCALPDHRAPVVHGNGRPV